MLGLTKLIQCGPSRQGLATHSAVHGDMCKKKTVDVDDDDVGEVIGMDRDLDDDVHCSLTLFRTNGM